MARVTGRCTRHWRVALRRGLSSALIPVGGLSLLPLLACPALAQSLAELRGMSIEQLANIEITSVSRQAEPLSEAAAAVYVITNDQIRRSGARTLAEALRLAPNLEVAQVTASTYSISARGFNTVQASNKLLVMVDGRSMYTPLHGGVFWDQQQIMLEDVERIEVISGPGGTLWGANAVNGVINIITRSAANTKGGRVDGYMGMQLQQANMRYGGALGDDAAYRVYGQAMHHAHTGPRAPGDPIDADDWEALQAGFRLDWAPGADAVVLQGDIFRNSFPADGRVSGGNAQVTWRRELSAESALKMQAYYDRVDRRTIGVDEYVETMDAELQHNFLLASRHRIVWGGGYRHYHENFQVPEGTLFHAEHPDGTVELGNLFVQDSIALGRRVDLTLGTKFEYSSYTGSEYLPSVHLGWHPSDIVLLWAAVSRAARTPSRIDRELTAEGFVAPARDFGSEEMIAYEIGYRGSPLKGTHISVSLYCHDYDELRALTVRDDGLLEFGNVMQGRIYGVEAWADYGVLDWWRLEGGVNIMEKDLTLSPPGVPQSLEQHMGNDPGWQGFLRTTMDLSPAIEFYAALRYVDDLPDPPLSDYLAVDARLGWRVTDAMEISVSASNIFGDHIETGTSDGRRIRPNFEVGANWRF